MLPALAGQVSLWNRRRKLRLFLRAMRPGPDTTIVDVGVGDTAFEAEPGIAATHNFFEAVYPWPEQITAVSDVPLPHFAEAFPRVSSLTASGTELPFSDDEFDIAISNAVVEHVGDREEQRRFVEELCRVAPKVFLSTPNRWFPVEVHTLVPLAHWLPRKARDQIFEALHRDEWRGVELLSPQELLALFPNDVEPRILESRITITIAAIRRDSE